MNLHKFFESLAANSGRNFKIDQLKLNSDNETLREVVRLALDPFTQFYQRKIPKYTAAKPEQADTLSAVIDSLQMLSSRQVTGNAAIDYLTKLLSSLTEDDAKVLERIIQKDLKCGVQVSTANSVWTGLVSEYPVMLCSQFDQKLVDKVKFPALVQIKMDGMRFNAIVKDGKVEYRSRNGKEIQLLGNMDEDFINMAGGVDCVFDGELLVNDKGIVLDRQTGNGILNKANKGTISDLEAHKVRATVWDVIHLDEFKRGKSVINYGDRWSTLCLLNDLAKPKKVSLVQSWQVDNYDTAKALFEELLQRGEEGIILKDMSGVWEDKRAKHQIKFKGELECDLEILAVEEGTGKYVGRLGAIVCGSRLKDGKRLTVSVGSGFNDDHRTNLWNVRDSLVGKIVAVKYNMRIKNKQGEESLFLPIFVEIREDKDVADDMDAIS